MAIKEAKQIIDTAVGVGKSVVNRGVETAERLRGRKSDEPQTSGAPSTVGAAEPARPGGHKSATAPTKAKAKAKPRKPAKRKPAAKRS